jgi:lauroyl/myristoyl acyltransferase
LVCPTYTTPQGWIVRIGGPIQIERSGTMRTDVTTLTRAMAAEFERVISAHPADWHMFQPAWAP